MAKVIYLPIGSTGGSLLDRMTFQNTAWSSSRGYLVKQMMVMITLINSNVMLLTHLGAAAKAADHSLIVLLLLLTK